MDQSETGRLRKKLNNLSSLKKQLEQHDAILSLVRQRSQSWQGASEGTMTELGRVFAELSQALPEKAISFDENNNDIDALQAKIVSARSKAEDGIARIHEALDVKTPDTNVPKPTEGMNPRISEATDKRRVFVVHGRNMGARDAMFALLRAIDLDPIEWEEAIQMTGSTSPHTGIVLDVAFSNAQAAVILVTGDDVACLGEQFVETHDPAHERQLTAQARPNVLFEMGMAFGKYPSRTLIVEFGHTRPFSDLTGRNTIHFRDTAANRKRIADRLKHAGCSVKTDNKVDWLTVGDFSSAFQLPRQASVDSAATITNLKEQITRLEDNQQRLKNGIQTLSDQRTEQAKKIEELTARLQRRDKEVTELHDAHERADQTANASLHEQRRQIAVLQQDIHHLEARLAEKNMRD